MLTPVSTNAQTILCKRYLLPVEGQPCPHCGKSHETVDQMFWRASFGVQEFHDLMARLDFLPNSPTLMNAGTVSGQLSACYKLNIKDTMLGPGGITDTATKAVAIQKFGGGVGYNFNELRPKGAPISTTHGVACGVVSVMSHMHSVAKMVTQGGKREGAQMGLLSISHPDILEFIHSKDDLQALSTFNISISIPDSFMEAVLADSPWDLISPQDHSVWKTVQARDLWDEICGSAWRTGDPGVFFVDTVERDNPTPWLGKLDGVNPCLLGTTRMLTMDGLIALEDLVSTTHAYATPIGWSDGIAWKTGTKPVVNVILSNGQSIVSTEDHEYAVGEEWVEAGDLEGTLIKPFVWHHKWVGREDFTVEDMILLGFLQGDGSYHDGGYYAHVGRDDADIDALFGDLSFKKHGNRRRYIPASSRLAMEAERLGMSHESLPHRPLPSKLWSQSPELVTAFLRGLFSANGSILETARRVSLKSTNLPMVRDVQLLLLALGFRPYITTNKAMEVTWPNGTFTSRPSYQLNVVGSELTKFVNEIGFVQKYKQERLSATVGSTITQLSYRRRPTVIAVEPVGEATVYDFNVSSSVHSAWANGLLVSNCGEVPLLDGESCNLGSINLVNFVQDGGFDHSRLREVVRTAVRFLDRILAENKFPMELFSEAALKTRKLGLGVMGWADTLALLSIHYDSDEAVDFAETVMSSIQQEAHLESERLAREYGPYPASTGAEHRQPQTWYAPSSSSVRRNAALTCIAPTGTVSQIAGCSSGIEPHFALENERVMGDGTVLHERVAVLDRLHGFTPHVARQISPEWHVRHQAAFQKYVDLAVSKTVNMAESATPEDISNTFFAMWKAGVKGGTIFRDGSRVGVLTEVSNETAVERYPEERPRRLPATVTKLTTGHGNLYMSVTYKDGKPFEAFSHLGKAGGCDSAQLEAISRLISLAFRSGIQTPDIVKQLQGITCCPTWDNGVLIRSIPDGMARVLTEVAGSGDAEVPVSQAQVPTIQLPAKAFLCPECFSTVYHQEGCLLCPSCGYSRC